MIETIWGKIVVTRCCLDVLGFWVWVWNSWSLRTTVLKYSLKTIIWVYSCKYMTVWQQIWQFFRSAQSAWTVACICISITEGMAGGGDHHCSWRRKCHHPAPCFLVPWWVHCHIDVVCDKVAKGGMDHNCHWCQCPLKHLLDNYKGFPRPILDYTRPIWCYMGKYVFLCHCKGQWEAETVWDMWAVVRQDASLAQSASGSFWPVLWCLTQSAATRQ